MPDAVSSAILQAAIRLEAAGIEGARREARWLALRAAGQNEGTPLSDTFTAPQRAVFDALVARRALREPLQHVLGDSDFYGLSLSTDSRALIPRADSECVVERALDAIPADLPCFIADLGTGSGCLLLAILAHRPKAMGVGIDASADAIALARENAERTRLAGRVQMTCVSWCDWKGWPDADVIISNPPYIRTADIAGLAPEVRDHDPLAALDGGRDGLDAYRQIISLGAKGMKTGAHLFLEIGYDQREAVSALLLAAGFSGVGGGQDLAGHDRVVWAQKQHD